MRALYLSIINKENKGALSSLLRFFLMPFSYLYYLGIKVRESLYRLGLLKRALLPVPVISIGNITLGGTGKTPLVELVTRFLLERGKKVAILSRGYRATKRGSEEVNDEYLELLGNLPRVPILLGRDRLSSARKALMDYRPDCLILDDGFQHHRLARDLDIVVLDSLVPFGSGGLIPAGTLREPLTSLKRADLLVLSRADQCNPAELESIRKCLQALDNHIPIVEAVHYPLYLEDLEGRRLETSWLRGKRVYAFCGLGNPASFEKTLGLLSAELLGFRGFPDHHYYSTNELDVISREAARLAVDAVITTQKDMVKIRDMQWRGHLLSLRVEMRITRGQEAFSQELKKAVGWT